MHEKILEFIREKDARIQQNGTNQALKQSAADFNLKANSAQYSYNFSWMGRPIIQFPQDMIAVQELIWSIKPDLIIETGIAHGGSILYYASLLELLGKGEVLGIDIDIRQHNREEIEKHPMFKRVKMIQGSSISDEVVNQVKEIANGHQVIMLLLDSNHTHDHVLRELELYAPLVTPGSYAVVFDTIVEFLPDDFLPSQPRPWKTGNNPWTAAQAFLKEHSEFEIDHSIDNKLLISVAPEGYLKRIR